MSVEGLRVVESLHHVVFICAEYEQARNSSRVRGVLESGGSDAFLLHTGRWEWRELTSLRKFFIDILAIRASALGGARSPRQYLQEVAEANW